MINSLYERFRLTGKTVAVKAGKEKAEQNKTTGSQNSVWFYGSLGDYWNFARLDSERNSATGR
jgi:hypothetical protein